MELRQLLWPLIPAMMVLWLKLLTRSAAMDQTEVKVVNATEWLDNIGEMAEQLTQVMELQNREPTSCNASHLLEEDPHKLRDFLAALLILNEVDIHGMIGDVRTYVKACEEHQELSHVNTRLLEVLNDRMSALLTIDSAIRYSNRRIHTFLKTIWWTEPPERFLAESSDDLVQILWAVVRCPAPTLQA